MSGVHAFIDTETTGLDAHHMAYEVCIWRYAYAQPDTFRLPHTLHGANAAGLRISRYFERGFRPFEADRNTLSDKSRIFRLLQGATLVGSNPSFDANMMLKYLGVAVWHHRFIDVSNVAMTVFDWAEPKGLFDVANHLRDHGWEIPEPDHSAEGDVRTTKAVYDALRDIRTNDMSIDPLYAAS